MLEETGVGSLKLVVADGGAEVEGALREHVPDADLRQFGEGAWVAYTDVEPAEIRDWIAAAVGNDAPVFVVEFERWSAFGDAIDRAWLLRRGH